MEATNQIVTKPIYINSYEKNASSKFGEAIYDCVCGIGNNYSEIIVLCIGTDRATGDSLGPLTGHMLKDKLDNRVKLYGTLEKPVHAKNLHLAMKEIQRNYSNPLIVAVDACLGKTSHIGNLIVKKGAVKPGAGVNKQLPVVGDISVTGVVNFSGVMELMILQNTRLNIVMQMAEVISDGLYHGLSLLFRME